MVCMTLKNILIIFFVTISSVSLYAAEINKCIKNAVLNGVALNKILTICRENIDDIDVYSNSYDKNKVNNKESNYISTSRTDEIIREYLEKGDLSKAGRLAEKLESEKTKRLKALADAEALRSPQIIANNSVSKNTNEDGKNIRSILTLNSNPITTLSAGSKVIEIATPSAHGAIPGQFVTLTNVIEPIDGIAASELNTTHVISSVPSTTKFRISVLSEASSGSVSGGGTAIVATFQN
tara:strand:+ start:48 stop:761 length:714 start_codon:yes stop_codon:yes gene_type:complete